MVFTKSESGLGRTENRLTNPLRVLEWTVMPFGLTHAPATFQRTTDIIFSDMIDYTDIYVDNIVVYSESLEDHLVHLRKVLQRLREHQLFVNLKKCSFAQSEIEFVGFIVGRKGIRPVPEKLQTISDLPVPKNVKHVLSFVGLCCFYHKFFQQFATIASSLTALTWKSVWHWGATEQRAFEELKECFLRHVVLAFPDMNKPYILYTDASDTGVGAMLCQEDDEKGLRLVVCIPKTP